MDMTILNKANDLQRCINLSSGIGIMHDGKIRVDSIKTLLDLDGRFAYDLKKLIEQYNTIWSEEFEKL